ncbi:hypothetical protein [Mycobacterium sp. OTB74]|nr:hypothetical protein [Mycobacterium sp. OTB74]MDH6244131.1 hypothetical protein [Mycobacterium sp. OTB74]
MAGLPLSLPVLPLACRPLELELLPELELELLDSLALVVLDDLSAVFLLS